MPDLSFSGVGTGGDPRDSATLLDGNEAVDASGVYPQHPLCKKPNFVLCLAKGPILHDLTPSSLSSVSVFFFNPYVSQTGNFRESDVMMNAGCHFFLINREEPLRGELPTINIVLTGPKNIFTIHFVFTLIYIILKVLRLPRTSAGVASDLSR